MMSERYTESDLLAWLEDELGPARREALETALAADPAALRVLRQMREDREVLRTAGQPELPRDLVADLEPQLSRPMLIEHEPGQYRRNLRGRTRSRRLSPVRLALAAVFLLVAVAGIWAVAVGLPGWTGLTTPERIVTTDPAGNPGAADGTTSPTAGEIKGLAPDGLASTVAGPFPPEPGTIVHHRRPLPAGRGVSEASLAAGGTGASRDRSPDPAGFALVVRAEHDDDGAIGEAIAEVVRAWLDTEAGPESVALVRNFSFDEADQLLARLRRDPRGSGSVPDALTGVAGEDRGQASAAERRRRMAELLRNLERGRETSAPRLPASGRLAGPRDLEPSYERQLEFSSGGAEYTLTVSAERLNELLARLRSIDGMSTGLRAIGDGRETTAGATGLQRWVEEHRAVQALMVEGGEGYLLVPVIVEGADR